MRYLLLCILPIWLVAQPFKVASYNVENLFDSTFNATEYKEYIPNTHNWTSKIAKIKLEHTAEVICDLDADIIGLQEIENETVLNALNKLLSKTGCIYRYSAISHKKDATIQVALLSKYSIEKVKELQVSYSPKVRNILEVQLKVQAHPLTVFVNHWKSKGRRGYESKRIAYAKVLQKRISKFPDGKEYIILGDLNSNYNAHLTLKNRLNDTHGKTGITDILKTCKNHKLIQKNNILENGKGFHYNPWQEVSYKKRWSHKFYGHKGTLDHILLPSVMFDGKGIDYVNHSFSVFKAPYLFTKKGYINSWEFKSSKHNGKGYSDHLPVFAYFDTKPYISQIKDKSNIKEVDKNIEYLYTIEHLDNPVILKKAVVILKRGRYAVIKQYAKGRGIFLYGCVDGLKEGLSYDLRIQEISSYRGLKEIISLVKEKVRSKVKLKPFYGKFEIQRQNEVLKNIVGVYKNRYLFVNGEKLPIYFKNRKLTPKNGEKIKIHYAHLGYYKKLQLVIYSNKDFEILE